MGRLNKILLLVFIVLVALTGFEVLFFIFFKTKPSNLAKPMAPSQSQSTETKNSDAVICNNELMNKCNKLLFPSPSVNQAINEEELMSLRVLRKSVVKSSVINYTYEGIISEVSYTKDSEKTNLVRFRIRGGSGDSNSFTYTDLPFLTVRKNNDPNKNFFLLKNGDKINVGVEFDLISRKYIKIDIQVM